MKVSRALVSVSDKTGLEEFARGLAARDITILSTGGTGGPARLGHPGCRRERGHGLRNPRRPLKTQHRASMGASSAARRCHRVEEMAAAGIEPIDLGVVNLYPFEQWLNAATRPTP